MNNFLRLNVETFNTLLLVFQPELERVSVNRDKTIGTTNTSNTNSAEYVSAVGRRMLPALRLYSKWLLVSHEKIHNTLDDTALAVQTKQLWQTYANTLSLLAATFDVERLHRLDYMLEEDEDIIGFLPLKGGIQESGLLMDDKHTPYRVHPNEEQLSRVLLLLEDGLKLCDTPAVPIAVVDGTIIYQEDGMNTSILPSSSPTGLESLYRPVGTEQFTDIAPELLPVPPPVERPVSLMVGIGGGSVVGSVAPSESASVMVAMNRMVDSLVGPRGGTVSEEDEDDLIEEEERGYKDSPQEEEEIVFVGRRGRSGDTLKKKEPTLPTIAPVGESQNTEGKRDYKTKYTTNKPHTATTKKLGPVLGKNAAPATAEKILHDSKPSIYGKHITPAQSKTSLFENKRQQQPSHPSQQLPQILSLPSTVIPNTPQLSPPPPPPPGTTISLNPAPGAGGGTYTASDLVKQLHSYTQKMNATNVTPTSTGTNSTPTRSPQAAAAARGPDLWWSPGGAVGPGGVPGVNAHAVYTEGETNLFLYGPGSGWS